MTGTALWTLGFLSVGLALGAIGCGESESTDPVVRPMAVADRQIGGETAAADSDEGNEAPVIDSVAIDRAAAVPGQPMRAVVDSWDPDDDFVRLAFSWYRNGLLVGEGVELTLDEVGREDRIEVHVVASDGRSESDPVVARIRAGNREPYMTRVYVMPDNQLIRRGEVLVAYPEAADLDNDALNYRYRWLRRARRGKRRQSVRDRHQKVRHALVKIETVA